MDLSLLRDRKQYQLINSYIMTKERIIKRFERNGCKIVYTKLTNKILVSHKEFIKVFPSLNKAYQTIFNKPKEILV